jgi:hypothetical protein
LRGRREGEFLAQQVSGSGLEDQLRWHVVSRSFHFLAGCWRASSLKNYRNLRATTDDTRKKSALAGSVSRAGRAGAPTNFLRI